MTSPLSVSVNIGGTQLPGGIRGDTGLQIKKLSDFDQLMSDLARSPEAPSENPEETSKCSGFPLKAGLELPNLLEEGAQAIDQEQEHTASDKQDCVPENADRICDDGVPISNFIGMPPAPFINVLPTIFLLGQLKTFVDTKGKNVEASEVEGQGGPTAPTRQGEQEDAFLGSELGAKVIETGAHAPVSGEAIGEQWTPRDIQLSIKDRPVISDSAEVSAKEFTKVAAKLRDLSPIGPGGASEDISVDHSAPLMKLHISEISSHFPVILMESIFSWGFQPSGEKPNLHPGQMPSAEKAQLLTQRQPERMRMLRFELEPAELGQVLVKMRVRETRVEIAIEAQSVSTTDLLSRSRDALSVAIEHNGLKLHVFDVATQTDPVHTKLSAGGEVGGSREDTSGRRASDHGGFFNEERSRQERRESQQFKAGKSPSRGSDDVSTGILL